MASKNGQVAASVGFGGEVNVWSIKDGQWVAEGKIVGMVLFSMTMLFPWPQIFKILS